MARRRYFKSCILVFAHMWGEHKVVCSDSMSYLLSLQTPEACSFCFCWRPQSCLKTMATLVGFPNLGSIQHPKTPIIMIKKKKQKNEHAVDMTLSYLISSIFSAALFLGTWVRLAGRYGHSGAWYPAYDSPNKDLQLGCNHA